MRKKDIGKPTVVTHMPPGTPEQVAANREHLRSACESAMSELAGHPVQVTLHWPDEKSRTQK